MDIRSSLPASAPDARTRTTPFVRSLRNSSGGLNIRPLGLRQYVWDDLYHRLMVLGWARLFALFSGLFLVFNLVFAALYSLDPRGLAMPGDDAGVPHFWRAFFFSVHTVATIGYGNIYPVSAYANVLVVVEITFGIMVFALTTGLMFARFSRPTARIRFSRVAVIRWVDGDPLLMLRAANQRLNLIYAAEAHVSLIINGKVGSTPMRRFHELALVRKRNPIFAMTWMIMHRIDKSSPLRPWIDDPAHAGEVDLVVVLSGSDESSGQTIHGRTTYCRDDMRIGAHFVDIIGQDERGRRTIDYDRFDEIAPDPDSLENLVIA